MTDAQGAVRSAPKAQAPAGAELLGPQGAVATPRQYACHTGCVGSRAMVNIPSWWSRVQALRPPMLRLAPVLGQAHFGQGLVALMAALLAAFVHLGAPKAPELWRWIDVVGEGGLGVMAGVWLVQLRASRPAGRVTNLLCLGLSFLLLGQWVDVLDEFWSLPKTAYWDNWLESTLVPLGTLLLTLGLHHARQEQLALTEALLKRERLFREHRSLDGVTQLGDAAYMAAQITVEQRWRRRAGLVMLRIADFETLAREHGLAEADRCLQAASHLLLLNLSPNDLLCRYGADRFCVLLPGAGAAEAHDQAQHLAAALSGLAHHTRRGERLCWVGVGCAGEVDAHTPAEEQLLRLHQRLLQRAGPSP
jgi:diguanylate cyclase (GGDEF)-like protein